MGFGASCSGQTCRLSRAMLWSLTCSTEPAVTGWWPWARCSASSTDWRARDGFGFQNLRVWWLKETPHQINFGQSCLGSSCIGKELRWCNPRLNVSASALGCFSPDRAIHLLFLFLCLFQGCSNKSSDLSTFQPLAPVAGIAALTQIHGCMETKFCISIRYLYLDLKNPAGPCFFNHDTKPQWPSEAFEFQTINSHPAQLRGNLNTAIIS